MWQVMSLLSKKAGVGVVSEVAVGVVSEVAVGVANEVAVGVVSEVAVGVVSAVAVVNVYAMNHSLLLAESERPMLQRRAQAELKSQRERSFILS